MRVVSSESCPIIWANRCTGLEIVLTRQKNPTILPLFSLPNSACKAEFIRKHYFSKPYHSPCRRSVLTSGLAGKRGEAFDHALQDAEGLRDRLRSGQIHPGPLQALQLVHGTASPLVVQIALHCARLALQNALRQGVRPRDPDGVEEHKDVA